MEQSVPAVAVTSAGKQETTACGAGVGSADTRSYKKENLQILTIFVKLSAAHFKQFPAGNCLFPPSPGP